MTTQWQRVRDRLRFFRCIDASHMAGDGHRHTSRCGPWTGLQGSMTLGVMDPLGLVREASPILREGLKEI